MSPEIDEHMKYTFEQTNDTSRWSIPSDFLDPLWNTLIPNDLLRDLRGREPFHIPVVIIVLDMYETTLNFIENTRNLFDLMNYFLATHPSDMEEVPDSSMLELSCSKVIEQAETKIHKEKCLTSRDCSAYDDAIGSLIPAMVASFLTDHKFLLHIALRCLRGAPIKVFSDIFLIAPNFPFHLLEEGYIRRWRQ